MVECKECGGRGATPEYHGPGLTEMLSCVTCEGTGKQLCVVNAEFVADVEEEVGMGCGAWDMVPAVALCEAIIRVAAREAR